MSALLSAEDALEQSAGAPQRIAGVICCFASHSKGLIILNPSFLADFMSFESHATT
jgi:hypothetical protein